MWKGVIKEESLESNDILELVKIIDTRKATLEKRFKECSNRD